MYEAVMRQIRIRLVRTYTKCGFGTYKPYRKLRLISAAAYVQGITSAVEPERRDKRESIFIVQLPRQKRVEDKNSRTRREQCANK
ncbi:hypothetical protein TSAR_003376 [Trichomalopsis sarcophagae]|uniref:Uncharacterized protein n=1 Tax=Trichomalopsis sarcophagae TaxID=543379 RepID=A0A232EP77_9HYME|nr:hypothetical protein TSAR_003376 [Trichomalopsis sarcophagae]